MAWELPSASWVLDDLDEFVNRFVRNIGGRQHVVGCFSNPRITLIPPFDDLRSYRECLSDKDSVSNPGLGAVFGESFGD
jgi:hypothetical protein